MNDPLPPNYPHQKLQGRCFACGDESLFRADGGFVICSRAECPDPGAVADLLDRPRYHILDVTPRGWQLQHAVTCFPNLLDCRVHQALVEAPIRPPEGRWIVSDDMTLRAES